MYHYSSRGYIFRHLFRARDSERFKTRAKLYNVIIGLNIKVTNAWRSREYIICARKCGPAKTNYSTVVYLFSLILHYRGCRLVYQQLHVLAMSPWSGVSMRFLKKIQLFKLNWFNCQNLFLVGWADELDPTRILLTLSHSHACLLIILISNAVYF